MKNIAVVADKNLRKEAIRLVHGLSKLDDVKAVYWTPKEMRDNEAQVTGRSPIIFLGKNSEAIPYIDLIKPNMKKHGVVWGYDGSKAAIYIDSEPKDYISLKNELDIVKESWKDTSKYTHIPVGALLLSPFFASSLMLATLIAKKSKIRKAQYKFGVLSFTQDGLDEYLEQLGS